MKPLPFMGCLALLTAALHAGTEAPLITSAAISPVVADITETAQSVTVTLDITDDASGLQSGNLFLYNAASDYVASTYFTAAQRTAGDALDGTYEVSLDIPMLGAPGTWRIDALVADVNGNLRQYGPTNTAFPVPADMTFTVVNNGDVDDIAPEMTLATVSPGEVDTSGGPGTLTFTIHGNDAASGVDYGLIYPSSPTNGLQVDLITYFDDSYRTAGDEFDGTYEVEINLPPGSDPGEWNFDVYLKDNVGNASFTPGGSFQVTNSGGGGSDSGFLALAVDAVPLVFTTGGPGWIITSNNTWDGIDAAVTRPTPDNTSNSLSTTVTGPGTLRFHWRVDSEENEDVLSLDIPSASIQQEVSGFHDWSEEVFSLPPGTHTVTWSYTKNAAGSGGEDSAWIDQVRFTADSGGDMEAPRLQDLRSDTRVLDVSSESQDLYVHFDVTDDHHGLSGGTVYLIDPSGNTDQSFPFGPSERVSGDELAGTYELFFTLPPGSETGVWRLEVELTEETTSLTREYGPGSDPFPMTGSERFFVGGTDPDDTSPSDVWMLDLTPRAVDLSTGAATLTATLQIADLPSGFDFGWLELYNPDGDFVRDFFIGNRLSGDEFNGTYQIDVEIPPYGQPGVWSVGCFIQDFAGNTHEYPDLAPFPASVDPDIEVVNGGVYDEEAPMLTSIEISPLSAGNDTAANIQFTISLSDDLSGRDQAYVYLYDPSNQFRGEFFKFLDGTNRISGDDLAGTYQFSVTLPAGSMAGQWRAHVFVRDKVGRYRVYGQGNDAYPEPGDGYFTVTSGAGGWFASKMQTSGLSGDDAKLGADPDGDGMTNAAEVCAGTDPSVAGASGFSAVSRDAGQLHLDFTVHPSHTVGASGDFLTISDGSMVPMRVTGEVADDLAGPWTKVLPVPVAAGTYRVSLSIAGETRGFIRLRFENP